MHTMSICWCVGKSFSLRQSNVSSCSRSRRRRRSCPSPVASTRIPPHFSARGDHISHTHLIAKLHIQSGNNTTRSHVCQPSAPRPPPIPLLLLPLKTRSQRMPAEIQAPPEVPSSQPGAFSRAKIECSLFKNASAATTGSSKEQSAQQKLVYLMGGVSARKGRLITRIPRIIDKKKKRGLTGGSAEWWERSPASEAAA